MPSNIRRIILPLLTLVVFVLLWEAYVMISKIPGYIVPSPASFSSKFIEYWATGQLAPNLWVTLQEIVVGTVTGSIFGVMLGYIVAKIPLVGRLTMPSIVLLQTAPKISLAPLFVLWFGLGISSKVALVFLVVFFPIMINCITGLRSIHENYYYLLRILKANFWRRLTAVELPACMPYLAAGMRVAVTNAVVGAVIGELIGAKAGLGYLLSLGAENFDIRLVLSSVLVLSVLSLLMDLLLRWGEARTSRWRAATQR